MSPQEIRRCAFCGEPLTGRIDKKYCTDQCRNNVNNNRNRIKNNVVRCVNNVLRKNLKILESLHASGKRTQSPKQLSAKGFNFDFYTHVHARRNGQMDYYCYDHGYSEKTSGQILILNPKKDFLSEN